MSSGALGQEVRRRAHRALRVVDDGAEENRGLTRPALHQLHNVQPVHVPGSVGRVPWDPAAGRRAAAKEGDGALAQAEDGATDEEQEPPCRAEGETGPGRGPTDPHQHPQPTRDATSPNNHPTGPPHPGPHPRPQSAARQDRLPSDRAGGPGKARCTSLHLQDDDEGDRKFLGAVERNSREVRPPSARSPLVEGIPVGRCGSRTTYGPRGAAHRYHRMLRRRRRPRPRPKLLRCAQHVVPERYQRIC